MNHRAYAKRLLVHYFELVYNETTGGSLAPDCVSEIESIVDSIIEAAKQETGQGIREQRDRGR